MKRPEQAVQRKILTELFRGYRFSVRFHVPNEGRRGEVEGYNNKLNGVLSGVSDLVIVRPFSRVGWIEVKAPGKDTTKTQDEFIRALAVLGHKVYVIDNTMQLEPILQEWRQEDGITVDHAVAP